MDELKKQIDKLVEKSVTADKSDDAMKFAQAALNLSHTLASLKGADAYK